MFKYIQDYYYFLVSDTKKVTTIFVLLITNVCDYETQLMC